MNNLHSGSLLFNDEGASNQIVLDTEVSDLRFFTKNCNYWFVAACWEGRVAFF